MRKIAGPLIATAFIALAPAVNAAGVVYNWVTLTTNPNFTPMFGSLVVDSAYWLANDTISFNTQGQGLFPIVPSSLLSFSFGGSGAGGSSSVDYQPFSCGLQFPTTCPADRRDQLVIDGVTSTFNFQLNLGSLLTGFIAANDGSQNVTFGSASGSPVWTVGKFRTDGPGPGACIFADVCGGGTGLWVLDRNTVPNATPVPEPETFAMWIAGLLVVGAALSRDWRRKVVAPAQGIG